MTRLGLAAFLVATAAMAQPLEHEVAIEDPSGRALAAFHRALVRAREGRGRARVVVWGASHVASDQYPGMLREDLQRRFGDAGPGFVLPAQPFAYYAHRQIAVAPTGVWRGLRVLGRSRAPDAYGPAGFALDTRERAVAWAEIAADRAPVDAVTVHYLRRPGGGSFDVEPSPGGERRRVRTSRGSGWIELRGPIRRVSIATRGDGPVRLFGVSMERATAGVLVDSFGVPGARLPDRLPWQDAPMRAHLARLAPDLVVLAYGTNESGARSLGRYREEADEAVRRARRVAPRASCLLVGPSDWPERREGAWVPRARAAEVTSAQRAVARRHGCGFFDLAAVSGGPGSMPRWVQAGLGLEDHVHFTDEGHRIVARMLSRALLAGL